jgi:preprotein translocase subunit SecY
MKGTQTHELRNRIIFTFVMLAVYLLGRCVPLFGAGAGGNTQGMASTREMAAMMFSGDRYQTSLMALGVLPYINASLLVQIVSALRSVSSRARVSKQKMDRWMIIVTALFAAGMAIAQASELALETAGNSGMIWILTALELFAGAMLTCLICLKNEKHGIGASMPIILLNILVSFAATASSQHIFRYPRIFLVCAVVVIITIVMESKMVRIPLQRVSVHNIHAEQNYMAYKLNPTGIMPVMFATAAFLVPRYIVAILAHLFPSSGTLADMRQNMVMTRPLGIAVYLIIIVLLSAAFAFIMLNPRESARQLQKNGDSIIGVYAGQKTTAYLVKLVLKLSIFSGILQAFCMGLSLVPASRGMLPASLAMIPSAAMILVSIICSLIQEIKSYRRFDAYSFFL